jgi:hypothetical protein
MDEFFEKVIHQHLEGPRGSGEDAEFWRRVFYDFRKMHFFVFHNQFPEQLLDVFAESESWNQPVLFLKNGTWPGEHWRGVIGQSMTAPLLFLMREMRRIGVLRSADFDKSCFYMNSPAKSIAFALGWIDEEKRRTHDIEALADISADCHQFMSEEAPDLIQWFDLPLQLFRLISRR